LKFTGIHGSFDTETLAMKWKKNAEHSGAGKKARQARQLSNRHTLPNRNPGKPLITKGNGIV